MLILKNSLSWMILRLILFMYEKTVMIDRTSKCQHFTASQSSLLHMSSEITLNYWTSAAVHSLLRCTSYQRSSWIWGILQLLFTVCCVAHHIRDHPKFLDFSHCSHVAHHIRDHPEFEYFFSYCSQSAVLHITSDITLIFWTSAAAHSLLCCTPHQRSP